MIIIAFQSQLVFSEFFLKLLQCLLCLRIPANTFMYKGTGKSPAICSIISHQPNSNGLHPIRHIPISFQRLFKFPGNGIHRQKALLHIWLIVPTLIPFCRMARLQIRLRHVGIDCFQKIHNQRCCSTVSMVKIVLHQRIKCNTGVKKGIAVNIPT